MMNPLHIGTSLGRAVWPVTVAMMVTLAAVGCTGETDPGGTTTPLMPSPTGELLAVDPVDQIRGATLYESDGLSVLVPPKWQTKRYENDDYVQILVVSPDDSRTMVSITIEATDGDTNTVEVSSQIAFSSAAMGGATNLAQRPAQWPGWLYATAITATADDGNTDVVSLTMLSATHRVIGVVARAPAGTLLDSSAYQSARSLKETK
ncbi:MAG: hypothetical protein FWF02_09050 [Micrococcales bacterium]|nr:hypothetical protein [Micrococcales bacterium]